MTNVKLMFMFFRSKMHLEDRLLHLLAKRVKMLYEEWQKESVRAKVLSNKPSHILGMVLLIILVAVEIYKKMGNQSKALRWASLYLSYAQHPLYNRQIGMPITALDILPVIAQSEFHHPQMEKLIAILDAIKHKHVVASFLGPFKAILKK